MVIGIVLYRVASHEPNFWVTMFATCLALVFAFVRSLNRLAIVAVLTAAVMFGFALMSTKSQFAGTRMLQYPKVVQSFHGEVVDLIKIGEKSASLKVAVLERDENERLDGIRFVRLTIRAQHFSTLGDLRPGDRLVLRARFAPVPKPIVPHGYDAGFQSYFEGIGAYGTSLGEVELFAAEQQSFFRAVESIRQTIGQRIDDAMNPVAAGIARALIIGDQSKIADELRDQIAVAGLAHVLAISGLHLTLVVGTALVGIRAGLALTPLADKWVRPIALICAIGVALGYLAVSGANLATQRATLMLLLAFGALLVGRRAVTMRNVAIAAFLIICVFPHEIFKPGFQLSFAAVLGLVAAYSEMRQPKIILSSWAKWIGGLAATSLIAGIATAPIAAYHFQQFAPLGLVGNLIVVPIVGMWVLPLGFFAVLLMPFGLEQIAFALMANGIDFVALIAREIAKLSGHLAQTPVYHPWTIFGALLSLAWLAFFRNWFKVVGPVVYSVLFLVLGTQQLPTLLISDTTQGVAVMSDGGFHMLGRKSYSFTYRVWGERFDPQMLERAAMGNCDRLGCAAKAKDYSISLVKTRAGLHEDCGRVDVIIAKFRGDVFCDKGLVISQRELDQKGVAAAYLKEDGAWHIEWSAPDVNRAWR